LSTTTRKVLVVDNHPLILKLMANLLEKEGHEVLTAKDGLSALEILNSFVPDIIFIDLVMPNINGEKLCRVIRATPEMKDVHLVVLSGIAAEKNLDVTAFGANACIAKGPFKQIAGHVITLLGQLDGKSPHPGILGFDTVNQREITKELLSSRKHLEVIINNVSEGVLEITPAGKIIFINPSAARLLGRREENLLATDFSSLFAELHRTRVEELLERAALGPQTIAETEPVLLNKQQVTLHLLPLLEEEDSASVIVIMRNITQWKQNERELEIYRHHLEDLVRERNAELLESNKKLREEMDIRQEMEKHLRQVQKMEALGTLAGGMAHDFKNILQIILGHADLIRSSGPTDPELCQRLEKIGEAGHRANHLLQQILTFSRKTDQAREPVQLRQVVNETLSLFTGVMQQSIRINLEMDELCPPVLADASQMKQVLFNLITNARQAMGEGGGTLEIALQEVLIDTGKSQETGLPPDRYARLTVRDAGPGMKKEILDRIFEPYFTTKEPGEGTGLGLAAVHGIVKGHKGAILAGSTEGEGSIFRVFLPLASGPVH
jgi:PAS domain S-box-containing protein